MSISNSLSNAISGMNAASRLAEIVSSNVANAMTDGYGRRSLELRAAAIGGRGSGVEIGAVNRHVDRGILSDRRLADAERGGYDSLVTTMSRVQDVVGLVGDPSSISARITAVEAALLNAASDPASSERLSALQSRLTDLTTSLNTASDRVQVMRAEADASIASQVDALNTALSQVERLNGDITYIRATNGDPSALMDERQRVIDKIAEIVPVRELEREGARVALMTPDGQMLIDGKARSFEFTATPVITPDMTLASGGLEGILLDGQPLASDGIGKLNGGTLGAAFAARDHELVLTQSALDEVASDLILRLQDPAVDPSIAVGQPGLLTDAGAAFDVGQTTGISARISLNAAVDPALGGDLSRLRDGVAAATAGPPGNASLLDAIGSVLSAAVSTSNDPVSRSAAGRAASMEASFGNRRLDLESELSFATARWTSLKEAESAGGVDTDFEMQMLLRVEQAYAANARLVQTVESMLQTLMEL